MRWFGAAILVLAVGCDPPAPTDDAPSPVPAAVTKPGSVDGTYRLTKAGRAKVVRWARTLHKEKAVPYVDEIHVGRGVNGSNLLVAVGAGRKGPYALRPDGKRTWSYPLSKRWTVHVTHNPRRDRLKVRIGPVTVTYRRVR